jgi:hypothetical protein
VVRQGSLLRVLTRKLHIISKEKYVPNLTFATIPTYDLMIIGSMSSMKARNRNNHKCRMSHVL